MIMRDYYSRATASSSTATPWTVYAQNGSRLGRCAGRGTTASLAALKKLLKGISVPGDGVYVLIRLDKRALHDLDLRIIQPIQSINNSVD